MSIPISTGSGAASVAAEAVGGLQYQQIEVLGKGGSSVLAVNPDGSLNASIIGTPNVNVSGSVFATFSGAGSVIAVPVGSVIAVLQGSSVLAVPVGSTIAVLQSSSILAVPVGSVVTVWKDSSILSVPVGSVVTVWQSPSIVGTYAEDAAHTTGEKGLFGLSVRNDELASVTSADRDYSAQTVGPVGETVTANAPITKWVRGTADLRVVLGASVTAIAAQGASVFTYITGIQLANMGSASVLVTFAGGLGSILGYSIAPAGGGSNILYPNALKTGENSAFTASISGTASVLVSAQGFTAKI